MINPKLYIFIFFSFFYTPIVKGQTLTISQIEDDLHRSYLKMLPDSHGSSNWEQLEIDGKSFREKFEKYTSQYPSTLTANFVSLKKDNIKIVSSDDSLLRIYSWDTWQGGTMRDFECVFQYQAGGKIHSFAYYDTSRGEGYYIPFYSQIFTLDADSQRYYLVVSNGIYSSRDVSQSINIFTIKNDSLRLDVPLIKTKEGIVSSIDIEFDFFSVVNRPERPLQLIRYESKNKTIFIPVVDDDEKVTKKFIRYKFIDGYFERVKLAGNLKIKPGHHPTSTPSSARQAHH